MASNNIPESEGAGVVAPAERRRNLRFPFTATVEMTEYSTGAKIPGRTADLGLGGCYIDTLTPLPVGTEIKIKILKDNESFEAQAKVMFSQLGMGMGIAFLSAQPNQVRTFQKWIQEISGKTAPLPEHPATGAPSERTQTDSNAILSELILTLMKKRVLTDPEGKELLRKLFQ
jgi:PilZ domain-containing protein